MNILVSACLIGAHCRYDGESNERPWMKILLRDHTVIPVCPEQLGGLSTPRPPVEWADGRAMNDQGEDCTEQFMRGAKEALRIAKFFNCHLAILKAKSPSCGQDQIYDGTFSGQLTDGKGATVKLLEEHGISVIDEISAEVFFRMSQ